MKGKNAYLYYQSGREVICVSHYAGKIVRAVAKCSPNDEFDLDFGQKLARARVDYAIAKKKVTKANEWVSEAIDEVSMVLDNQKRAMEHRDRVYDEYVIAVENLNGLLVDLD